MAVSFVDGREVLGQKFVCDQSHLDQMCKFVGIPEDTDLSVVACAVESEGHNGSLGRVIDQSGKVSYTVNVAVSDRLEFSAEAVRRVNRNLAHELRHIAQHVLLSKCFTTEVAEAVLALSQPVMCQEAYLADREVKLMPEVWALTPEAEK